MASQIELRPASAADLRYLSALASDRLVEPFLAPGAGTEERLEALLIQTEEAGDPSGLFVIQFMSGAPVGGLALQLISANSRICELTRLMVDPRSRRSGIAAAAVRIACRRALIECNFHRVQAETYRDNLPGRRLFESVGFVREGVRRRAYWRREQWLDGVLYGLLAEELPRDVRALDNRVEQTNSTRPRDQGEVMASAIEDVSSLPGEIVKDQEGRKVGEVKQIYAVGEDETPMWVTIEGQTAGIGNKRLLFVPLARLKHEADEIRVPYSFTHLQESPEVEPGDEVSAEDDRALRNYYAIEKHEEGDEDD